MESSLDSISERGRKIGIGVTRLAATAEPAQSKQSLNCWLSSVVRYRPRATSARTRPASHSSALLTTQSFLPALDPRYPTRRFCSSRPEAMASRPKIWCSSFLSNWTAAGRRKILSRSGVRSVRHPYHYHHRVAPGAVIGD